MTERLQALHEGKGNQEVVQLGSDLLYLGVLSGIRLQISDQVADRQKVFSRWTVYAKHDKDFLAWRRPTAKSSSAAMSISFIDEGRVTQELHFWDMVALLQQIQAP